MASDSSHQHDTASESRPTFAMRAVMSSIRMTFPKVPQLSCATLAEWLEGKQQPSESIVLLVSVFQQLRQCEQCARYLQVSEKEIYCEPINPKILSQ